ncbi:hypothetical protein OKA05_02540 [Luteolibacter arcticus]|uniref:Amino acid permease/ SLC12A domain-containing protein n=1 Tax=Luteolibacter arcticus TaxID=1581411 RepID=A0ABT3GCR9_9BACT|nr:hypothetical protein [Luteolibacter arcticus]MCW1921412.1 hypothetical protein [Luteolibacter arcticus]
MIFPLLGSGFAAFMTLISGAVSESPAGEAIILGVIGLGSFVVTLTMTNGAVWLDGHLSRTSRPFASAGGQTRPMHPARQLFLPPTTIVVLYGSAAVALWIPDHLDAEPERNFIWPVVWIGVAVAATFLRRYLKAKFPG